MRVSWFVALVSLMLLPLGLHRLHYLRNADGVALTVPCDLTRAGGAAFTMRQPVNKEVSFTIGWTTPRAEWTGPMPGDGQKAATNVSLGDLGFRFRIAATDPAGSSPFYFQPVRHTWDASFERGGDFRLPVEQRGDVQARTYASGFRARQDVSYEVKVTVEKPLARPHAARGWIRSSTVHRDGMQRLFDDGEATFWYACFAAGLVAAAIGLRSRRVG